jgi:hypothetical protein
MAQGVRRRATARMYREIFAGLVALPDVYDSEHILFIKFKTQAISQVMLGAKVEEKILSSKGGSSVQMAQRQK